MSIDTTTTRPAGTGGIDLSGVDVAQAIFEATGGTYGTPRDSTPTEGGTPSKLPDWITNFGNSPLVDAFDFSQLPADRDAPIKLLAEPEGSHPLIDLFKGEDAPDFANGGPEGTGFWWVAPLAVAAVVVTFAWAVDHLSDGAICDALGWEHDGFTDPDTMTDTLQSPAEMVASLLGKAGIEGVDPTSVEITDLLSRLSDNMGKVTDLMGALTGAAQSGDAGMFDSALSDLMNLAGLDAFEFDLAAPSPQDFMDGVFEAFGIAGGLDGADYFAAVHDSGYDQTSVEMVLDMSTWVSTYGDIIA